MVNKRDAKCKPLDDDIRKIENIFLWWKKVTLCHHYVRNSNAMLLNTFTQK